MITRIVNMHFREGEADKFLLIFEEMKVHIAQSEGCFELNLHRDSHDPNQFFTLSRWQSEAHLNRYRDSDLFKQTWARVKPLFAAPAKAWTTEKLV